MSCLELYDRDAAVAYARQYALSFNSQYANYANSGGDCMNFVSQCLHAECQLSNKDFCGTAREAAVAHRGRWLMTSLLTSGSPLVRHA